MHVAGKFGSIPLQPSAILAAEKILDTSGMQAIDVYSKTPYGEGEGGHSAKKSTSSLFSSSASSSASKAKGVPSNPYAQSSKAPARVNPYAKFTKTPKPTVRPQPATVAVVRERNGGGGKVWAPMTEPRATHSLSRGISALAPSYFNNAPLRAPPDTTGTSFAIRRDEADKVISMREAASRPALNDQNQPHSWQVVNSISLDNARYVRFDTYGFPSFFRSDASTKLLLKASVGMEDMLDILRSDPTLKKDLLNQRFVSNHYDQILWKLAGMERKIPLARGKYLCSERVLEGLRERFKRELVKCQRPAVRKILNRDAASTRM
jgi:hypothetical protein